MVLASPIVDDDVTAASVAEAADDKVVLVSTVVDPEVVVVSLDCSDAAVLLVSDRPGVSVGDVLEPSDAVDSDVVVLPRPPGVSVVLAWSPVVLVCVMVPNVAVAFKPPGVTVGPATAIALVEMSMSISVVDSGVVVSPVVESGLVVSVLSTQAS